MSANYYETVMNREVKCPKCNGKGEVYSGYFGHPETSDGGPVYYRCSVCDGKGVVKQSKALEWTSKNVYEPDCF